MSKDKQLFDISIHIEMKARMKCDEALNGDMTFVRSGELTLTLEEHGGTRTLCYRLSSEGDPLDVHISNENAVPLFSFRAFMLERKDMSELQQGLRQIILLVVPVIAQMNARLEDGLLRRIYALQSKGEKSLVMPYEFPLTFIGNVGLNGTEVAKTAIRDYFSGALPLAQSEQAP